VGRLYHTLPLWVLLVVYGTAAVWSSLNIGHRHLLPIYPALFILAGAAGAWVTHGRWIGRGLVVIGLGGVIAASVWIWPDYLAYFNWASGGPDRAYRRFVDSSLDWGQDLPTLKRWLKENVYSEEDPEPVYLCYFGTASPRYHGLECRRLPGMTDFDFDRPPQLEPISGGTYCVSATVLQGIYCRPEKWTEKATKRYDQLWRKYWVYQQKGMTVPYSKAKQMIDVKAMIGELMDLDNYRRARLCAYFLTREPDAMVGHSILIYRITEDEAIWALYSPLPTAKKAKKP
jgi:hypothetical protein